MHHRGSQRVAVRMLAASLLSLSLAIGVWVPEAATAQIVKPAAETTETTEPGLPLGQPIVTRYRVGAQFNARGGTVRDIRTMVAVPLECPEQQVATVDEDVTPNVEQFEYRQLDVGVRQMLIGVPQLSPREEARAIVTYDVTTSPILPPADLSTLHVPKKLDKQLKRYIGPSPFIDANHRKIKQAVKEALAADDDEEQNEAKETVDDAYSEIEEEEKDATPGNAAKDKSADDDSDAKASDKEATAAAKANSASGEAPADPIAADPIAADPVASDAATSAPPLEAGPPSADWLRIEKLYDFARKKVKYEEGEDKSSVQALADELGDCQGISALFVAMCRTEKVPARMVWADGHQYAEFYLEDAAGVGRWYPVESAGARAFGEMPTARVILQKGDNFKVPERPRDRLRYASDFTLLLSKPGFQPKIAYVHEQM